MGILIGIFTVLSLIRCKKSERDSEWKRKEKEEIDDKGKKN